MKKKITFGILVLGVAGILTSLTTSASENNLEPGSVDDPIVTKSYVDEMINDIKNKIIDEISKESSNTPSSANTSQLSVVKLNPGETIIGFEGTQFIPRNGKIVVVKGNNGDGLPDITEGTNIEGDKVVPLNHMVMVPRNDNRGIKNDGSTPSYIMVVGKYQIMDKSN